MIGRRLLKAVRLYLVNGPGSAYWMPRSWRLGLYRACGLDVGDATIFSGTIIRTRDLHIGEGSFLNHGCVLDRGRIHIGRNVYVSSGVVLASADHEIGCADQRAGRNTFPPVVIEDGAWIGANVVVLGGVRVRRGCVIGAGAIVHRSTEPDGLYVGVPARRVRTL